MASDVNPMPRSVKNLAKSFDCKTYYPEKSLTTSEKIKLLEKFREIKGYHQKDALAAAIKAYKHYHSMLKKIQDELKVIEMEELFEDVASKIISCEVDNIKAAIEKVLNERRIMV